MEQDQHSLINKLLWLTSAGPILTDLVHMHAGVLENATDHYARY